MMKTALAFIEQSARFAAVAAGNVALGLAIIYSLLALGLGPISANAIGYLIAIPISYLGHARISFGRQSVDWRSAVYYLVAVLVSYGCNLAVLFISTKMLDLNGYLAQVPAIGIYALVFFLLSRFFVFSPARIP